VSEDRRLRVGLIGAGMIGRLRAEALRKTPSLRLAAVADLRSDLARAAAKRAPAARLHEDVHSLASDPDIDAVIVATPPDSHEELGLACLAAGKHVLCEKPLAATLQGAERLVAAAEKADRRLATGFNLRYTRAAMLARRLVDGGAIGKLDHIRAFHGHPGGDEFTHDWIRDAGVTGGGTLMDNGIHLIDLSRWFLGEVVEATGMSSNRTWRSPGAEDNGFLLLRNEAGCVATLHSSWTEWRGYGYRLEVYGTEGFVTFGYPPMYLLHGARRGGNKTTVKRHLFPGYQVLERLRGWEWGLVETLVRDLEGWGLAIREGKPAPISGRDGAEAVRIARLAAGG
jgi:predicted dehydrogenase